MKHEDAEILLPELLRGGLDATSRSEVAEHLAGCETCRALSATYDVLAMALRRDGEALSSGHLASLDVVNYAVHKETLSRQDRDRIAQHLRQCDLCRAEIDLTEQARRATLPGRLLPFVLPHGLVGSGTGARAALLASAAVLVVLGYSAYLGVARLPDALRRAEEMSAARSTAEQEAAGLRASLDRTAADLRAVSEFGGAVELNVLESPRRGDSGEKILRLRPRQPFLLIAVLPTLPSASRPGSVYRFALRRPGEEPLWSDEMTVAQIRERLRSSGVVTLVVPASRLASGKYRIEVTPRDPAGAAAILEVPFEVAAD